MNPLGSISWNPDDKNVEKMKKKLSDEVLNSSVPDAIKDQHADKTYNPLKPYDQDIKTFLDDTSFALFLHQLQSTSKALRNSDFADAQIRKDTLKEVVSGWNEVSKVLFVLTPILAQQGFASFEGYGFHLSEEFKKDKENQEKLFMNILRATPHNVINYVKDDLSSDRLEPLLLNWLETNSSKLSEHLMMLYFINERPKKWGRVVDRYIADLDKNSLYLLNTLHQLEYVYRFDYSDASDSGTMGRLLKKCLAKHHLSIENPVGKNLEKIPNSALPKRVVADEDENGSA